MSQEQMKVLQMLDEGKITAEEATTLLQKVAPPAQTAPVQTTAPQTTAEAPSTWAEIGEWLRRLLSLVIKEKVEEQATWQIDSAGLQTVAVQTTNGAIDYRGDGEKGIAIQAHKVVRAPDQATAVAFMPQVQIQVEPQADTLRIYPTYPKPPRHVEVEVTFIIHGPRQININGRSTNGAVTCQAMTGAVQVESTNGEIRIAEISGAASAQCTNGGVNAKRLTLTAASNFSSQNGDVRVDVQQGQAPITATTVNGSVHLTLPPDYQGQLDARTQNGQVRTSFQTQITARSRNRLVGQIGGGGEALLKLQSQNGDVTLAAAVP
ncbi:MAG: hypothetical protein DYG89_43030 [Caldilinea sp. CFX5]|nr:hypothetical protein [Caldilinea sp. CFX5]